MKIGGFRTHVFLLLFLALLFTSIHSARVAATSQSVPDDPEAAQALLVISKTAGKPVVRRGEKADYTIVVFNSSQNIALLNVTVSDPLVPDCSRTLGNLAPGEDRVINCSKLNVQQAFTNVATVEGQNANNGMTDSASDSASIEVIDLTLALTPQPSSLAEPGGTVAFSLSATNTGSVDVTLNSLNSPQYGDLFDADNSQLQNNTCARDAGNLPQIASNGGMFECSFEAEVVSQPGQYVVVTTAVAEDGSGNSVTKSAEGTLTITNVKAGMNVTLNASPDRLIAPGGVVTLTLEIENTSAVDTLSEFTMIDSVRGNVDGQGDCEAPLALASGASYTCSYSYELAGPAGSTRQHTLTVTAVDDDDPPNPVSDTAVDTIELVEPPTYVAWLPAVVADVEEPNDECRQAYGILVNQPYFPLPDDEEDWFYFELTQQKTVTIEIKNFVPLEGQGIVYQGASCSVLSSSIANEGSSSLNREIKLGSQPPGRYYVRMINDGAPNTRDRYELFVRTR